MKEELDKLFEERSDRKQKERDVENAKETKETQFRDVANGVINNVIGPALKEFQTELKKRGNESDVTLQVDKYSQPSARLTFRVIDESPTRKVLNPSKISFSTTTTEDKFEVRREVWTMKGKEDAQAYGGGHSSRAISEVDEAWVRSQVLAFINAVLSGA